MLLASSLHEPAQNLRVSATITIRRDARSSDHLNHSVNLFGRLGLPTNIAMVGTSFGTTLTRSLKILDGLRCCLDRQGTSDALTLHDIKRSGCILRLALEEWCYQFVRHKRASRHRVV